MGERTQRRKMRCKVAASGPLSMWVVCVCVFLFLLGRARARMARRMAGVSCFVPIACARFLLSAPSERGPSRSVCKARLSLSTHQLLIDGPLVRFARVGLPAAGAAGPDAALASARRQCIMRAP